MENIIFQIYNVLDKAQQDRLSAMSEDKQMLFCEQMIARGIVDFDISPSERQDLKLNKWTIPEEAKREKTWFDYLTEQGRL